MRTLVKLLVGLAALIGLSWLFLTTLQDTIAEPYDIDDAMLSGWTLAAGDVTGPGVSVLGLQPPSSLTPALFDQLFNRTMASMTSPARDTVPIVLQSELQGEVGAVLSPDEILMAARAAGIEQATIEPVCMAVKRQLVSGRTRELYFVVFEMPAVSAFRQRLSGLAAERGVAGAFGEAGFDLTLVIAGSDAGFESWRPLTVDRATDCQAPLT
jgi:hypothetical protein